MSDFKIGEKTENNNPNAASKVLVEKAGNLGDYESVRLYNLLKSNSIFYKTKTDWDNIPIGTGDRLVPNGVQAGLLSGGDVVYTVVGNGSTDFFDLKRSVNGVINKDLVTIADLEENMDEILFKYDQLGDISLAITSTQLREGSTIYFDVINTGNITITAGTGITAVRSNESGEDGTTGTSGERSIAVTRVGNDLKVH